MPPFTPNFLPQETLELFRREAQAHGLAVGEEALAAFDSYAAFLVEYNEKVNLTAITDPEGIAIKHFLDSILLLRAVELPQGAKVIDVGTGAGFPSIPVKILRPDLQLTLMDSLQKRIVFLEEVGRRLGQQNRTVHARAEEGGRQAAHREQYHLATARAVADLRVLAEYCLPLVEVGGYFAALKGPDVEEELERAEPAIRKLGAQVERVCPFTLPGENRRTIVVMKKISHTSGTYPRISAKIAKSPL